MRLSTCIYLYPLPSFYFFAAISLYPVPCTMQHPSGLDGTPTEVHLERDEILIFFLLLRTRTLFWIVSLLLNLEVSADNPVFFFFFFFFTLLLLFDCFSFIDGSFLVPSSFFLVQLSPSGHPPFSFFLPPLLIA